MNDEQRNTLINRIVANVAEQCGDDLEAYRLFEQTAREEIHAIEPLIDEMITGERDRISLSFHEGNQLLALVKFHEWREPRPGFVHCPECKIEFQATPIGRRSHRAHCRIAELIKILQAKLTSKGSTHHAVSENTSSTPR